MFAQLIITFPPKATFFMVYVKDLIMYHCYKKIILQTYFLMAETITVTKTQDFTSEITIVITYKSPSL